VSTVCVCIFVYADDILLIAPSVSSLQTFVHICETELMNVDMSINVKKSFCIRVGPRFNAKCVNITSISGLQFEWVGRPKCRYLGVFFMVDSSDALLTTRSRAVLRHVRGVRPHRGPGGPEGVGASQGPPTPSDLDQELM